MCFRCFIPKLDDPNCHLTDEEIKNLTIPYDTASEVRLVGYGHFSALQKKKSIKELYVLCKYSSLMLFFCIKGRKLSYFTRINSLNVA